VDTELETSTEGPASAGTEPRQANGAALFPRSAGVKPGEMKASMMSNSFATTCADILRDFAIEIADTPGQMLECHRLRHQVYCVEREYLLGGEGVEVDAFDARSRHALLRERFSGEVVGTVRLVLPDHDALESSFPVQAVCRVPLPDHVTLHSTAEISRVAISKDRRSEIETPPTLLRLALFRAVVMLTAQHSITHWCAAMERTMLRLLKISGIHFLPHGGLVDHHGPRQPCFSEVASLLSRMRLERPDAWSFITGDGLLLTPSMAAAA
jgi:N-acyl-L-homoserine lactone synthetase